MPHLLTPIKTSGPITPGEVVLFRSGYSNATFKPLPDGPALDGCMAAPLAGKAEGWPALTPEAIAFLAEKKVRCIGLDSPTAGGVEHNAALMTYWAAAKHGVLLVEFLTRLDAAPEKGAFFLFAPIKIAGTRNGYGRAILLH